GSSIGRWGARQYVHGPAEAGHYVRKVPLKPDTTYEGVSMTRCSFVFVALAATVGGSSCSSSQAAGVRTADPPSVAVVKAVTGNLAQTLAVGGGFCPFQENDIHPKVRGYLKSIRVDGGDRGRVSGRLAGLEVL